MNRLAGFMRRARALCKIRALEIQIQGQTTSLAGCTDESTRLIIGVARRITQRELVLARQRYHDLLAPGNRRTWEIA